MSPRQHAAGTHAHSMVQLFLELGEGEDAAFDAYAVLYPNDALLLVDTVDTLGSGIPNAIATFERLRRRGHRPAGVRLDSGDLAYLAVRAAAELDLAGFDDCAIVLSSQLDELTIWQITTQIAEEARHHGAEPDGVIGRLASASAHGWRRATVIRVSTASSSSSPSTTGPEPGSHR